MKRLKLLVLLLLTVTVTGCSRVYPMKDPVDKPIKYVPPEPKFEPSPYQVARLYNASLPKKLLKSKTDEYFTLILPQFYTSDYALARNKTCSDFSLTIVPPGTYYNEEGVLEKDYVVATVEFVTNSDYAKYDTNTWRVAALNNILPDKDFKDKRFETYAEYEKAYTEAVNAIFKPTGEEGTVFQLTGELEPIRGSRLIDSIIIDEEVYRLPFTTYKFCLSSGNYLFVRLQTVSSFINDTLSADGLLSMFVLPQKGISNKNKAKLVDYLTSFDTDYSEFATEIIDGIIIGDLSSYYKTTVKQKPDNTNVDSEFEDSISDNDIDKNDTSVEDKETGLKDVETFGDELTEKQRKYKELLEEGAKVTNPNNSDTVINGFNPEDTYGGYLDYDADEGGHFEE